MMCKVCAYQRTKTVEQRADNGYTYIACPQINCAFVARASTASGARTLLHDHLTENHPSGPGRDA